MTYYRRPLQVRPAVRRAMEIVVTLSTAVLFSYLILQMRL